MAFAISNLATSGANPVSAPTPAVAPAASPASQPASLQHDTVKLSLAANIKLLHHQGLSPSIIASRLGIPVKQVNSYMPGVAQPAAAAAPAVPAQPEAPEKVATSTPAPPSTARSK